VAGEGGGMQMSIDAYERALQLQPSLTEAWINLGQVCVAVCCSVMQRVARCCSVLKCVAMRVLQCTYRGLDQLGSGVCCSVLRSVAVCCTVQ